MSKKKYISLINRNIVFISKLKLKISKISFSFYFFNYLFNFDDDLDLSYYLFIDFFIWIKKNKVIFSYLNYFFNYKQTLKWFYWRLFCISSKKKQNLVKNFQKFKNTNNLIFWGICKLKIITNFENFLLNFDFVFYRDLFFKLKYHYFFFKNYYDKYFTGFIIKPKNLFNILKLKSLYFYSNFLSKIYFIIFFYLDELKSFIYLNICNFLDNVNLNCFFKFFIYKMIKFYLFNSKFYLLKLKKFKRWRRHKKKFWNYKFVELKKIRNFFIFFEIVFFSQNLKEKQKINALKNNHKQKIISHFFFKNRREITFEIKCKKKLVFRQRFRRTNLEIKNNFSLLYLKPLKNLKRKRRTNFQITRANWLVSYVISKLFYNLENYIYIYLKFFNYFLNFFNFLYYSYREKNLNLKVIKQKIYWKDKKNFFLFSQNPLLNFYKIKSLNLKVINQKNYCKYKKNFLNYKITLYNLLKSKFFFVTFSDSISSVYLLTIVLYKYIDMFLPLNFFINFNSVLKIIKFFNIKKNNNIFNYDFEKKKFSFRFTINYFDLNVKKVHYSVFFDLNDLFNECCLYYIFFIKNINYTNLYFKQKLNLKKILKNNNVNYFFKGTINIFFDLNIYLRSLSFFIKDTAFIKILKNFLLNCFEFISFRKLYIDLFLILIDLNFRFFDNFLNNINFFFLKKKLILFIRYFNIIIICIRKPKKLNDLNFFILNNLIFFFFSFFFKIKFTFFKIFNLGLNLNLGRVELCKKNFLSLKLKTDYKNKFILKYYFKYKSEKKVKVRPFFFLLNLFCFDILNYWNNLIFIFFSYYYYNGFFNWSLKLKSKKMKKIIMLINKLSFMFILMKLKKNKKSVNYLKFKQYFYLKIKKLLFFLIKKKK